MFQKLLLIDGNAIFYRAFHSLPLFKTHKGEYTNAIYGFLRMFFDLYLKEKPDYVAIAWDTKAKTLREQAYEDYKATRQPPPPELYPQLPRLKTVLEAFHIPLLALDGYEADDILGTLTKQAEKNPALKTFIVTGDKDAFQLVTEKTSVITPVSGVTQVAFYDPPKVEQKMGVRPDQIIDYKALCGDSSDNIKGVPGIGSKSAQELLKKFATLENIYEHLDELPAGQRKKLESNRDAAFKSKELVTIERQVPLNFEIATFVPRPPDFEKITALLSELEFKSLFSKLNEVKKIFGLESAALPRPQLKIEPANKPIQPALF